MNRTPQVSVIIPTYNEEENIIRCLSSIKKQKYSGKVEIIVVDNYSTDDTVKLAKRFTSKLLLVGKERSRQRNAGAKAAAGSWLLFVDADMELSKGVLRECVELTKNHPVTPAIIINEKSVGHSFWGRVFALERNCYQDASWLQAARFFQTKSFLKLGGYDQRLFAGEDWDITQRFKQEGFPLLITNKSYLIHHESSLSLIDSYRKEIYYIKNIHRYAKKQPLAFSYQGSYLYRILTWARSWEELLRHPLLTTTFICYKFTVWLLWVMKKKV
ncbi:MAG: glycosyltransferase [Candidatus Levybacteria bacterium]|nr:glycosyltransferase [Candidatus Levybacteria bacterium]